MKTFTARVVDIVYEERSVEFEIHGDADQDAITEAAIQAACDMTAKPRFIGVMDRHVHDLKEKQQS